MSGCPDGDGVCSIVGEPVGFTDGVPVGRTVGLFEGDFEGMRDDV